MENKNKMKAFKILLAFVLIFFIISISEATESFCCNTDADCELGNICTIPDSNIQECRYYLGFCIPDVVQIEIKECQTIDESGNYYLNKDLSSSGTCITINADNVLLDCRRNSITGTAGINNGIFVNNSEDITIVACNITNYRQGIRSIGSSNIHITSNDVSENSWYGIHLETCKSSSINHNNVFENNGAGIFVVNSEGTRVNHNIVFNNGYNGIAIGTNSHNTIVHSNEIYFNNMSGIYFTKSDRVNVTGNEVYSNLNSGFRINNVNDGKFLENEIYENARMGVELYKSSGNEIKGNDIYNNNCGINLSYISDGNSILNNEIFENNIGVFIDYSKKNQVSDNIILDNENTGLRITSFSRDNVISENKIKYSKLGISIFNNSRENTISGNELVGKSFDSGEGIEISSSNRNIIVENTLSEYSYGIYLSNSHENTINESEIKNGYWYGITLFDSNQNNITGNLVYNISMYGIHLRNSQNNQIFNTKVFGNDWDFWSKDDYGNNIVSEFMMVDGNKEVIVSFNSKNILLRKYNENPVLPGEWDYMNEDYIVEVERDSASSWISLNFSYTESDSEYIDPRAIKVGEFHEEWRILESSGAKEDKLYAFSGKVDLTQQRKYVFSPIFGPILLSECGVIDGPGRWNIVGDLQGTAIGEDYCIKINANNVNLNCRENSISGNNNGKGIFLDSSSNSEIRNCFIENYEYGFYLRSSSNNEIRDNVVFENSKWDFYSDTASINTVRNFIVGKTERNTTISFTSKDVSLRDSVERPTKPVGTELFDCGEGNLTLSKHRACGADHMEALFNGTNTDFGIFNLTYITHGMDISIPHYIHATNNSLNSWLRLNISYTEEEIGESIAEEELLIWRYKEGEWEELPNSGVNTEEKYVYSGHVSDFSIFAPLGVGDVGEIDRGIFCLQDQDFTVLGGKAYCDFFLPFYRKNALIVLTGDIIDDDGNLVATDNNCVQYTYMELREMCYDWTGRYMYDCDKICDETVPDKRYRSVLTVPIPLHFTFGIKDNSEISGTCPENGEGMFTYRWNLEVDMVATIMADNEVIPVLVGENQMIDDESVEIACAGPMNLCYTEVPVCKDRTCDYELGENCWNCEDDCGESADGEDFRGNCRDNGCAKGCNQFNYLDREYIDERGCIIQYKGEGEFTYCESLCSPGLVVNANYFGEGNTFIERLRDRNIERSTHQDIAGRYVCCPPGKMWHVELESCIVKRGFYVNELEINLVEPGNEVGVCCHDHWFAKGTQTNVWARINTMFKSDNSEITFDFSAQFDDYGFYVRDMHDYHAVFDPDIWPKHRFVEGHKITRSNNHVSLSQKDITIEDKDWACLTRLPAYLSGGPGYELWFSVCDTNRKDNFFTVNISYSPPPLPADFPGGWDNWTDYVEKHYQQGEMYCDLIAEKCYIKIENDELFDIGVRIKAYDETGSPINMRDEAIVLCGGKKNPPHGGSDGCSLGLDRFIYKCADCDPIAHWLDFEPACRSKKLITGGLIGDWLGWEGVGTISCKRE